MSYIGAQPGVSSQRLETSYSATAGQTTFVAPAGYVPGNIDVFLNGIKLLNGIDFTASNGINIVLTSPAGLSDEVVLLSYIPRGLSDGYTKPEADAKYLARDASGNVGLGVTPSAWNLAGLNAFQVKNAAVVGYGNNAYLTANAYFSGSNWYYISNGTAAQYIQAAGKHEWFSAPSGTAGGVISFASGMVLDAANNLGIGVTPSAWISSYKVLQLGTSTSLANWTGGQTFTSLNTNSYLDASAVARYIGTASAASYQQDAGAHKWFTAPSGTAGNAISFTQAMTLDASGNLGLGTSSVLYATSGRTVFDMKGTNSAILSIRNSTANNMYLGATGTDFIIENDTASGSIIFGTGVSTERARIDSSGNLLVGRTGSGTSNNGVDILQSGQVNVIASSNSQDVFQGFELNAGGPTVRINVNNGTGSFINSSDYRLKENIVDLSDALVRLALLKPKRFNFISAPENPVDGFLAHEVLPAVPEAVFGNKDEVDENGNPVFQGLDQIKLIPLLTASILELKAEFDAYVLAHP